VVLLIGLSCHERARIRSACGLYSASELVRPSYAPPEWSTGRVQIELRPRRFDLFAGTDRGLHHELDSKPRGRVPVVVVDLDEQFRKFLGIDASTVLSLGFRQNIPRHEICRRVASGNVAGDRKAKDLRCRLVDTFGDAC